MTKTPLSHCKPTTLLKLFNAVLLSVFGWMITTTPVQAVITNPATGVWGSDAEGAKKGTLFATMFVYFWNVAITVGGVIVVVFFLQAAIEWITAGGDSGKIQKARERIVQSFLGLAILAFSFVLINFIGSVLFGDNFQLLNFSLPTPDQVTTE